MPARTVPILLLRLAAGAVAQSRPNVLLLVADDLGPEFVGCYRRSASPAATPVIDQLARGVFG